MNMVELHVWCVYNLCLKNDFKKVFASIIRFFQNRFMASYDHSDELRHVDSVGFILWIIPRLVQPNRPMLVRRDPGGAARPWEIQLVRQCLRWYLPFKHGSLQLNALNWWNSQSWMLWIYEIFFYTLPFLGSSEYSHQAIGMARWATKRGPRLSTMDRAQALEAQEQIRERPGTQAVNSEVLWTNFSILKHEFQNGAPSSSQPMFPVFWGWSPLCG